MEDDAMAARPSKRTRTSTAARGWSNLSSEICGVILSRVPALADRARFRSVCRQWRHAARQQWRLLPPALPWLTTSHKCVFVGFPDGARLSLPVHIHARSWEAFDRWILCRAGDGDGHLLLRNPLLSEDTSMVLPSAWIGRIVVCPGGELVAAMGYFDGLQTVAFCRPGARSWSPAPPSPEDADQLLEIALHRGKLYDRGTLCAYDLAAAGEPGASVRLCIVGADRPTTKAEARYLLVTERERYYLVPSPSRGGRLLLVRSKWGESFDVFEADEASGQWSEVTSLEDDEALFVGAHGSRGLQTASSHGGGVRGNRIYFADERYRQRIGGDNPASLGVYDMDTKTTSGIGLPRGSFFDDCKPTGSWLFPSTADL
ncbi:hypothetical protein ACQ4PT_020888 [Festuca glaucescens]